MVSFLCMFIVFVSLPLFVSYPITGIIGKPPKLSRVSRISSSLKMSTSDDYLRSLNMLGRQSLYNKILNAKECQKSEVEIDVIIFNIYRLKNIFFNRKSKDIIFKLNDNMKDLYYDDYKTVEKITNKTRIYSAGCKNFIFCELDPEMNVDALMFKNKDI